MTLDELKQLLGISLDDTTQDTYLTLSLESGIVAAQSYCDRLDFLQLINPETGKLELPAAVRIGITEWVRANRSHAERDGVVSESIGGMSQTFAATGSAIYSTAHAHWAPYHSGVRFIPMGRRR